MPTTTIISINVINVVLSSEDFLNCYFCFLYCLKVMEVNVVTAQPGNKTLFFGKMTVLLLEGPGILSYIRETRRHKTRDGCFTWVQCRSHTDTSHWSSVTLTTATLCDFRDSQGTTVKWTFLLKTYEFAKLTSNRARFPQSWEETLILSTKVFLPGESHEQKRLVGCCPQGCTESDMTDVTLHAHTTYISTSRKLAWSYMHSP